MYSGADVGVSEQMLSYAQVPVAIGGPGLSKDVQFRTDLKEPGLANVGPTIVNLLGFESPSSLVPSLLA